MWFKNLLIYRFNTPFTLSPEVLHDLLAEKIFSPCGSQDLVTLGWVPPCGGDDSPLVHAANGFIMVCLQRQQKLLPGGVVNEVLADKVAEIEENEDRKLGRKERSELKDEIIFELLPRAFTRTSKLYAYIDPRDGLLVVNTTSHSRAEELLSELRERLGSLPVVPLKTRNPIPAVLTGWLREQQAAAGFAVGGECDLRDKSDETALIRCRNQDLFAAEILNHLETGMYVTKMELAWDGGIECVVDEKLVVRRLRLGDLINERIDEIDADSASEQFDADFALMTGEFAKFIPALVEALGGETETGARGGD